MSSQELQQKELELKAQGYDIVATIEQHSRAIEQHRQMLSQINGQLGQVQLEMQRAQAAPIEARASEGKEPETAE